MECAAGVMHTVHDCEGMGSSHAPADGDEAHLRRQKSRGHGCPRQDDDGG
jgi:hypothetical protein